jgi:hypothetical protein
MGAAMVLLMQHPLGCVYGRDQPVKSDSDPEDGGVLAYERWSTYSRCRNSVFPKREQAWATWSRSSYFTYSQQAHLHVDVGSAPKPIAGPCAVQYPLTPTGICHAHQCLTIALEVSNDCGDHCATRNAGSTPARDSWDTVSSIVVS